MNLTQRLKVCILVSLLVAGCQSVNGFWTGKAWFNHSLPFYTNKLAFVQEYGNCQRVARNQIPPPNISYKPSGTRYVNGNATVWVDGTPTRVTYSGTTYNPYATADALAVVFEVIMHSMDIGSAEVACMRRLGWTEVPTFNYTPTYGNTDIGFNRTVLNLVSQGYTEFRLGETHSFLYSPSESFKSKADSTVSVKYAVLSNSLSISEAVICEALVYPDFLAAVSCSDNSSETVQLTEKSVIYQYSRLAAGQAL